MLINPYYNDKIECGCDEAGRGPIAGSLFASSVILPKDFANEILNDSKKLTAKKRDMLRPLIMQEALAWAVSEVTHTEIDQINILNSAFLGMSRAVEQLSLKPEIMLIDGNRFKTQLDIPYECIVKGDGKVMCIAAASILAKCARDEQMIKLAEEYPEYGWERNMGYPTKEHLAAIEKYGLTPYHRLTFGPCRAILEPTLF
ncbi:MAG: ribonuclease HII [Rikenellaceae bacterium]